MVKRASWLSVTPEPERELPEAVATMAAGRLADEREVARERDHVERLILRGTQRRWLTYLHTVVGLIESNATATDPAVSRARDRAAAVVANHHNLLLALPGRGASITSADRAALAQLTATTRTGDPDEHR